MKSSMDPSSSIDENIALEDDDTPEESTTPEENTTPMVGRRELFRLMGAVTIPLVAPGCMSDEADEWDTLTQLRHVNPEVTRPVRVEKSFYSQPILNRSELLSIDEALSEHLGLGDQCRIVRKNGDPVLFTVGEIRDEKCWNLVRMSEVARERFGTTDTFKAELQTAVVAEGLSDEEAEEQGEFVERLFDDGLHTGLAVLAPHAGDIELYTGEQAEEVRSLMATKHGMQVTTWICKGYGERPHTRWHITSTQLSRHSFGGLNLIYDRGFDYAVSFHGAGDDGAVVFIGGGAPEELRNAVRDAIADAVGDDVEIEMVSGDDPHSGDSDDNVVNKLTADGKNGVQISQTMSVREDYWREIAEAVVEVFAPLIGC